APALSAFPTRRSSDLHRWFMCRGRRNRIEACPLLRAVGLQRVVVRRRGQETRRRAAAVHIDTPPSEVVHARGRGNGRDSTKRERSEEHTSELQSRENL